MAPVKLIPNQQSHIFGSDEYSSYEKKRAEIEILFETACGKRLLKYTVAMIDHNNSRASIHTANSINRQFLNLFGV